jgi:hypothetical protein
LAETRAPLIALACFIGAAALAALFGRLGWRGAVWAVRGLAAASVVLGVVRSQADDGWAALGWFLFILFFAAPALLGAVLGGWLGLALHARR